MHSCSTCWNSGRHTAGEDMLREIADLGFQFVELGHGIRVSLLPGIEKFIQSGALTISSIHNFCPLPLGVTYPSPDCYEFSSHRAEDRERARRLSFQTIDTAERFGAHYVILHLGRVPMPPISDELLAMAKAGEIYSKEYVRLKIGAVRKREKLSKFYLARVKESLLPILEYAAAKNVHLGIESRQRYEQIPTERELPLLLEELNSPFVGYWHDFGHVQIRENAAFVNHAQWLTAMRKRLFGCHLHDLEWPAKDHRVPFTGTIDFEKLIPLLPADTLYVWEMSPRRKPDEIRAALGRWTEKFGK